MIKCLRFYSIILFILLISICYSETITEGVEYIFYELPGAIKIHIIKIDRNSDSLLLSIGFPYKKRNYPQLETTSQIFKKYDNPPNFDVIAAINGSFFSDAGLITGFILSDSNLIQTSKLNWETLCINNLNDIFIDNKINAKNGILILPDKSSYEIDVLNATRPINSIACYTPQWGDKTSTIKQGVEIIVKNVNFPLQPNKKLQGIVSDIKTKESSINNFIPTDGFVISARDKIAGTLQSKIKVGDKLSIKFSFLSDKYNNLQFMITGGGWILKNNQSFFLNNKTLSSNYVKTKNPRTVISWNQTNLFLIAVDGRQTDSLGMTMDELAKYLSDNLHCTDGLCLDSGGSTTMIVNGKLMNKPSDISGERPVANAILLVKKNNK